MTKSELFKQAHEVARRDRRLYDNYAEAFADGIRAVHASQRAKPVTTGFFIKEPWYKRQMWVSQRPAGWVTL